MTSLKCIVCLKPMGNSLQTFMDKPTHAKHLIRKFVGSFEVDVRLTKEAVREMWIRETKAQYTESHKGGLE